MSEFLPLDSHSAHKLNPTGDTRLVDAYLDKMKMYSLTVYLTNFRMYCGTTIYYFTSLLLFSIWNSIGRKYIPMPTKGSCLKCITTRSNMWKVKRMTSIIPFTAEFLLLDIIFQWFFRESDCPISEAPTHLRDNINPFSQVQGCPLIHTTFYCSQICCGDSNKVQ